MAVNVDTVYQRVLALANKEQRGYITPQEFNLLANQAQLEIFESYFFEMDRLKKTHGSESPPYDKSEILHEKLKPFRNSGQVLSGNTLPSDLYRLEELYRFNNICERLSRSEVNLRLITPMLKPTAKRPIYFNENATQVKVYAPGLTTTNLSCDYFKKLSKVTWGYVVTNEKALYNVGTSVDFVLHPSEEAELVYRILELAGITINKPGIAELADKAEKEMTQPKKQ
tara:strand:- start:1073 stop:1753 length:681 start_codon:yes stop_codon:yes gene_type:complete